ncbi:Pyridine nucleotide-disulfide oxidoreductase domain-containing protein 2 [Blattella germanica]|nr:Pyridine nucleotide-disulfide oxidoreductase domain-containing protein 2 [Blattella germanica]
MKYGLKVYSRNPSSYTPIIETNWAKNGPRSLTLGQDEESNRKQIARFSEKDAQMYKRYEDQLGKVALAIEPLIDLSVVDVMEFFEANSAWKKLSLLVRKPNLAQAARSLSALGKDIPALYELLTAPANHILNKWFESEPLKATLATDGVIGTMASPDTPGSG